MNYSKTISTQGLSAGYSTKKGDKVVLSGLDLALNEGELTCLLGPNGSGKSTLIRTLTNIQKPLIGQVFLGDQLIAQYSQKQLAKKISLVLTDRNAPGNLTAYALVSLGRFPYTSWMGSLSHEDKALIHWAMEVTGTLRFANTHIGELSDGEKQKVMIARALVQDTEIIILDEPTAHLDLPNRLEIFHLLQELVNESGKAILLSTHEMDMALTHADRLWLVNGQRVTAGVPEDLVLQGQLENAFIRESLSFDYELGSFKRKSAPNQPAVSIEGSEDLRRWTRNALERYGYRVSDEAKKKIKVSGDRQSAIWSVNDGKETYHSIEQLLINIRIQNEEND